MTTFVSIGKYLYQVMKYAITLLLLSAGLCLSASNGKIPRKIVRDSLPVLTERCEKVKK